MEIKIVHSNLETEMNLSVEINGLEFQIYWKPGEPGEVCCLTPFDSMTETELKNLLSSFKEAKVILQAECNTLDSLILPYRNYIVDHSQFYLKKAE